jgi:hypothetical protein
MDSSLSLCLRGRRCFSRSRRCRAICIPRVLFIAIYRRGSALNARDRLSRGSQGGYFFALPIMATCAACPPEPWGGAVDHVLMSAMSAIPLGYPPPSTPNLKDLRVVIPGLTLPAPQKTRNASTPHSGPGGISNMKLSKNVPDASRCSSYSQIIAESLAKVQRNLLLKAFPNG